MSVGALRSSVVEPDASDLLARARAIAALARERAQQTETDRRVSDDMIERMRQADLFRVMQPRLTADSSMGSRYLRKLSPRLRADAARQAGSMGSSPRISG